MDLIKIKEVTKEQAYNKIKFIIDLNKDEIFNICKGNLKCKDCDLNNEGWCILKNSYDQMENYFGFKKMNEYLTREVEINE